MAFKRAVRFLIWFPLLSLYGCASTGPDTTEDFTTAFDAAFAEFSDPLSTTSPPRRPTSEAGSIPASFAVTPSGAATYVIPIDVPPGRAGIQPRIALGYNSHRGNGTVGVGWAIEGLSEIRRCRKTPVQDGIALDVRLNSTDALCLDGIRLVYIDSADCENEGIQYRPERDPFIKVCAYGSDGRGPDYFVAWDKTGRIVKYGEADNAYPDQGIVEVNVRRRSSLFPDSKPPPPITLVWPVTRIADRRGNFMTIRYTETVSEALANLAATAEERQALSAAVGGPLITPWRIAYTGFDGSGNEMAPQRSIDFQYSTELRPDIVYGHFRGQAMAVAKRLTSIVANGPGEPGVWRYNLSYSNTGFTGRSKITAIQKCSIDGACLPPLTFKWSSGPGVLWTSLPENPLSLADVPELTVLRPASALTADVNGDGVGDLVQFGDVAASIKGSTPASPEPFSVTFFNESILLPRSGMGIPIDINNDKRMDILATGPLGEDPDAYFAAPIWYRSVPDSSGGDAGLARLEIVQEHLPFTNMEAASEVWAGDFNGDNAVDLLFYGGPNDSRGFWFALNDGTGLNSIEPTGITGNANQMDKAFVMDINGDGKDELLYQASSSSSLPRKILRLELDATGTLVWQTRQTDRPIPGGWATAGYQKVLDVNGDGLNDLITFANNGCLRTWRNTGATLRPLTPLSWSSGWGCPTPLQLRRSLVLDYDGDGTSELLVPMHASPGRGEIILFRWDPVTMSMMRSSTGITFSVEVPDDSPGPLRQATRRAPWVLAADVTRDGLMDLIIGDINGWRVYRRRNSRGDDDDVPLAVISTAPDRLIGIRTGLNPPPFHGRDTTKPSIEITYVPTTDPSVYIARSPNTGCAVDSWCVNPVLTVVSQVKERDVAPGAEFKHTYRDARVHHRGRGWLGFERWAIKQQTEQLGWVSETVEKYDVDNYVSDVGDFPYRFQPRTVSIKKPGGNPGAQREQLYQALGPKTRTLDSGTYFAFHRVRKLETRDYLNNASFSWLNRMKLTRDFDDFGNLTSLNVEVETPAPSSKTLGDHLSNTRLAERLELDSRASTIGTLLRTYHEHDESNWFVSRLLSQTATSRPGICTIDPPPEWLEPEECDLEGNTRVREFTYTPDGLLKTMAVEPQQPDLALTTTLFYDGYGNIDRLTKHGLADADGNTQTRAIELQYEPSEMIFPFKVSNALDHENHLVFDRSFGSRVFSNNPNGIVTWTPTDGLGRLAAAGRSGGPLAFFEYITPGVANPSIIWHAKDSRGTDLRIEYDRSGRAIRSVKKGFDGQPVHRHIRYDDLGRIEFVSFPYTASDIPTDGMFEQGITYKFDLLNRPTRIARPDGAATFVYKGLVTEVISPRENRSVYLANGLGQTTAVQDAAGGITQYYYSGFGSPAHVIDDDANQISIGFDRRGQRTQLHDPDLGLRRYRYNAFNELIQELNADGETHVRFDYDLLGRPTTRKDADGVTRWTWDTAPGRGIGALASSESPDSQTESRGYDDFGRLTSRKLRRSTTAGANWILSLGIDYDNNGRLRRLYYPTTTGDNLVVQYEYGQTGLLKRVRDVTASRRGPVLWSAKHYDAWGRVTEQGFGSAPNGQPRLTTTHGYDPVSARLSKIKTTRLTETATSESIQALVHWFDENGNLFRREDALRQGEVGAQEEFKYDELDRLSAVFATDTDWNRIEQTFSAHYNTLGNIENKDNLGDYEYRGSQPHAVTQAGDVTYRYDDRGNMKATDTAEITYTPFDLPRSVNYGNAEQTLYGYDARRVRAVSETSAGETTLYIDRLYERRQSADGEATEIFYIPADRHIGVLVRRPDEERKLFFLHRDHLGSPTVISSAEDGRVVETRKYGPFGRLRLRNTDDTDTNAIHIGFTGHEDEPKSNLVNMRGRMYDSRVGRFLSADPFVQAPFNSQSLNRYSYVFNNPVTRVDPSGYTMTFPPAVIVGNPPSKGPEHTLGFIDMVRRHSRYVGSPSPDPGADPSWKESGRARLPEARSPGVGLEADYSQGGRVRMAQRAHKIAQRIERIFETERGNAIERLNTLERQMGGEGTADDAQQLLEEILLAEYDVYVAEQQWLNTVEITQGANDLILPRPTIEIDWNRVVLYVLAGESAALTFGGAAGVPIALGVGYTLGQIGTGVGFGVLGVGSAAIAEFRWLPVQEF